MAPITLVKLPLPHDKVIYLNMQEIVGIVPNGEHCCIIWMTHNIPEGLVPEGSVWTRRLQIPMPAEDLLDHLYGKKR